MLDKIDQSAKAVVATVVPALGLFLVALLQGMSDGHLSTQDWLVAILAGLGIGAGSGALTYSTTNAPKPPAAPTEAPKP